MAEEKQDKNIIRVVKDKENPYTMINGYFTKDKRLSYKAKGILVYLLCMPDDWEVMVVDLIKRSTDGKKAVYSGLQELIEMGYMTRETMRKTEGSQKGQVDHIEYKVYEMPLSQNGEVAVDTDIEQDSQKGEVAIGEVDKVETDEVDAEKEPLLSINLLSPSINISQSNDGQTDLQKIIGQCKFEMFNPDVKNVFEGVINAMYFDNDGIKIQGKVYPQVKVREQLNKITPAAVELTLDNIRENPAKSKNSTAYYAAVLFNAIHEVNAEAITYEPIKGI